MAPFAAIFVALFWSTVSLLIAWSRGYTPRGIALCLGGILLGGAGAAWPGSYALTGWNVMISSEQETSVACLAILVGALCGLYVTERLRDHEFPSPRQLMTAIFGFLFGLIAGYIMLFFTYHTWAQPICVYGLIPLTIGSATLAGSAISHSFPD
jgi:hypothetical protein